MLIQQCQLIPGSIFTNRSRQQRIILYLSNDSYPSFSRLFRGGGARESGMDISGQPVTCSSKEALEWFNKGLVAYVAVRESSLTYFQTALQLDDSFVLAHCLMVMKYLPTNPIKNSSCLLIRQYSTSLTFDLLQILKVRAQKDEITEVARHKQLLNPI